MSEKLSLSVTINCPHHVVWDYITTTANWKKWYIDELIDVTPGWQNGAILSFGSGQKPTLTLCEPPNLLQWGKGASLKITEIAPYSTEIEYSHKLEGMFVEDPLLMEEYRQGFLKDVGGMLEKLKNHLEG